MLRVAIAGASGYVGGELLRLLDGHPRLTVAQATSERHAGRFVHRCHPNLRGRTALRFCRMAALEPCDVLALCLPHGHASRAIGELADLAPTVVDCSADFRLRDPDRHRRYYGENKNVDGGHCDTSGWRDRFVYGLAELRRSDLRDSRWISGVGCNATAVNLALAPLASAGRFTRVVADLKVGSSEAGAFPSASSHHPERSGVMRSFAPVGHRHAAEICEQLEVDDDQLFLSVTAVEAVRGVLATCHVFLDEALSNRQVWDLYRQAYGDEPFVRLVNDRDGLHRLPEPKVLAGSNYCDVGWRLDDHGNRLVVVSALDNLMKGAAGSALQALNIALGFDETEGLGFHGLHPA